MIGRRVGVARLGEEKKHATSSTVAGITLRDVVAGITNAVSNVPDAMANAVLAGLNPVQGLYSLIFGTPVASLTTGSQLMTVATTGSLSLVVADAMAPLPADKRLEALIVLTLMAGALQVLFGLLRAGTLLRFVSNAVIRGLLTGVAVTIVLSQVPHFLGATSPVNNKVLRVIDIALHPARISLPALGIGVLTIGIVLVLERTRVSDWAFFLALVAATVVANVGHFGVALVRDLGAIPSVLPAPVLPSLGLIGSMAVPALAVSLVGLIQGAGVSKTMPNSDGTYPDLNRDFIGQGLGNAAAGIFGGMPIGGSVSSTSLLQQLGATSRAANFLVGPIVALVILFFSGAVAIIPMTALASLLIVIGIRAVNGSAVATVWNTSLQSRMIMAITFGAMFVMPVQYAVLLGVALSIIQHIYSSSLDIRVVELRRDDDGRYSEGHSPTALPSNAVTALDIYGSVFFAGADVIDKLLPDAASAKHAVLIIRLRGRTDVGSTFIALLRRYTMQLHASGGKLVLVGIGPALLGQLKRTGALGDIGAENVYEARATLTASLDDAYLEALALLGGDTASGHRTRH